MSEKPSESSTSSDVSTQVVNSLLPNFTETLKTLSNEQKLPALIIILIIVSLIVVVSSVSLEIRPFLWFTTIPFLFIYLFFILPLQGKRIKDLQQQQQQLRKENEELKNAKTELTSTTNNSCIYFSNIASRIDDFREQLDALLKQGKISSEDSNELTNELTDIAEYVKEKKQYFQRLHMQLLNAEKVFQSIPQASDDIISKWQFTMDEKPKTK